MRWDLNQVLEEVREGPTPTCGRSNRGHRGTKMGHICLFQATRDFK